MMQMPTRWSFLIGMRSLELKGFRMHLKSVLRASDGIYSVTDGILTGFVGRDDGYAHKNSDISILVNIANKKLVTPISETFQTLIWHLLVSHPKLQVNKTKW